MSTLHFIQDRIFLSAVAAGVLLALAVPTPAQQIPAGLPLKITPDEFQFNACVNTKVPRTYTITHTGRAHAGFPDGPYTLKDFQLRGDREFLFDSEVNLTSDPVRIPNLSKQLTAKAGNNTLDFTIFFRAKMAGTYTADLEFTMVNTGGGAITHTVRFSATASDCPDEPQVPDDSGPDSPDDDSGGDDKTPPPSPADTKNVCIRFWIMNDNGNKPDARETEKKLDEWVDQVNDIYAGSGLKFERAKNKLEEAADVDNDSTNDQHCLNVYLTDPGYFEREAASPDARENVSRNTVGLTTTVNRLSGDSRDCRQMLRDSTDPEVADDFADASNFGTQMEVEVDASTGETIAHEIGHALGLGATSRNADGSVNEDHMDPDSGDPIDDASDRLMKPGRGGTKLTDTEKKVARKVADCIQFRKCETSQNFIPPGNPRRSRLRFASISRTGTHIILRTLPREAPVPEESRIRLRLEFDTNLDGRTDHALTFANEGREWQATSDSEIFQAGIEAGLIEGPLLAVDYIGQKYPDQKEDTIPTHAETRAGPAIIGYEVRIHRNVFPISEGMVGWRLTLLDSGAGIKESLPSKRMDRFDITRPHFVMTLQTSKKKRVILRPGHKLQLNGDYQATATFEGPLRGGLLLMQEEKSFWIPAQHVKARVQNRKGSRDGTWTAQVHIPKGLPPGSYEAVLHAGCRVCQVQSTITVGQVTVRK